MAVNETYQQLELSLRNQEASCEARRAQRDKLSTQLAAAGEKVHTLNDSELKLARLERQIDLASANYLKYAENLEQTRIDQALESEKISNINILQPAQPTSITPTSPQPHLGPRVRPVDRRPGVGRRRLAGRATGKGIAGSPHG